MGTPKLPLRFDEDNCGKYHLETYNLRDGDGRSSGIMVEDAAVGRWLVEQLNKVKQLERFTPTPEQINALPEGVRQFVAALETRCDPAGEVTALVLSRDVNKRLQAKITDLKTDNAALKKKTERLEHKTACLREYLGDALSKMQECEDPEKLLLDNIPELKRVTENLGEVYDIVECGVECGESD